MTRSHRPLPQFGFTLVEALVAIAIVSIGMLALVTLQTTISKGSGVSAQRSEALRLASEKMECLRSFTQIVTGTSATTNCNGVANKPLAWNDLASGADPAPITSSHSFTAYTRSWTISGTIDDPLRTLAVTVRWTDRNSTAADDATVVLTSVISKSAPADLGALAFPLPGGSNLKQPKNRSLNIPVPATDLGGGKSAYQVNPTLAVIFSNLSGYVIQRCNTIVTAENYANGTAGCVTYDAYIIAGYISGVPQSTSGQAVVPAGVSIPTGVNTDGVTGANGTISCGYGAATDQNTGSPIPGYKYYLCVIPVAQGGGWSGTIRLAGMTTSSAENGAPSNDRWVVCRFQYADASLSSNLRNVQPYSDVRESIDNQNYYVAAGSGSISSVCPAITSTVGSGQNALSYTVQTVAHQDCRSNFDAANCPTTATPP